MHDLMRMFRFPSPASPPRPRSRPRFCRFPLGFGPALRIASVVLVFAATSTLYAQQEEEKLATFFKSYLDQRFPLRPVEATQLGDHRFDSQLEDLTPDARARWLAQTRQA